jgi:hypothetical protein
MKTILFLVASLAMVAQTRLYADGFALETGKVVKLVAAASSDERDKIAKKAYFDRIQAGNCDAGLELINKLKPLMNVSELSEDHFILCAPSPTDIYQALSKLTGDNNLKRTGSMLRMRLDASKTKDEFIQNSLLAIQFTKQFPKKFSHYSNNTRLLLNAGRIVESKEEFDLKYGTNTKNPDYGRVQELIALAEKDPEFVSEYLFKIHNPLMKELYLSGTRELIKKYPDTLAAKEQLKELLTRYEHVYSKEELGEFYQYQNLKRFPFLAQPVPVVCERNRSAIFSGIPQDLALSGGGALSIKRGDGGTVNTCAVVDAASKDIRYLGIFINKAGKDLKLAVLPYDVDGWHDTDYYNSTAPVVAIVSPSGDIWVIERRCRDVEGEVGARKSFYSVYQLTEDLLNKVSAFEGFWLGDGGKTWSKTYGFGFNASGKLLATETYTKTTMVTEKISQDDIEEKVYGLENGTFSLISSSADSKIFEYAYDDNAPVKVPVATVITGNIYKSSSLSDPVPVSDLEVVILSRLRGAIEPRTAAVLKVSPRSRPTEVFYVRPEEAGEVGVQLGRSQ